MARNLIDSDKTIKAVKPADPVKRLTDGDGLYLLLFVNGGAHGWRLNYTFGGKRKTLSLGTYPDTGLALARKKADEFRKLIAEGTDPSDTRKSAKAAQLHQLDAEKRADAGLPPPGSFEAVAREWHEGAHSRKVSEGHAERTLIRLEQDVFPWLGRKPIASIDAPMLLECLRRIESRGAIETAHRVKQACGQVFRYGIATGKCTRNPAPDLLDALQPVNAKHMAAVVTPAAAGELMRNVVAYEGHPVTRAALVLSALLFQRPGNIRSMEWAEVDLDAALWTIPGAKMKRTVKDKASGTAHMVPLPSQAITALRDLQPLTGHGRYVFPSLMTGERCMSENTVNTAIRRMGYSNDDMTAHGFRAMARTLMVEKLNVNPEVIEAQLAHGKSGPLGAAYDRAQFMEQRKAMMQTWADYLDRLRDGAQVLPFKVA